MLIQEVVRCSRFPMMGLFLVCARWVFGVARVLAGTIIVLKAFEWFPTHMAIVVVVGLNVRIGLILVAYRLGYRRKVIGAKASPYECGFDPITKSWYPMPLRFFHLVLLFVL